MSESECDQIVAALVSCGINFLAIDFDLTLISEHTGGHWRGTAPDLAAKVRPMFKTLVPKVMDHGISVAIVTFSAQCNLIQQVLRQEFPMHFDHIPIRGEDKTWEYHGLGSKEGKQKHMASAGESLAETTGLDITRDTTLLLDDDGNNIRIALANKVRAIRFVPDNPSKYVY